ncbi:ATP-binding protein [Aureisphaera galaxeae]|uniref:tetratricopeptide repeat-containing hybrid sensor histidine kinase/response regulator n=1 Tax=Aureisphaera galaxeae TaxID=1538023 RepID=UPI002350525B|nr:ATP-binding protein [Aureisphaera galaxeae]MDC8004649.1 ATP-binding protein [Aureisphaera galaxeae]
MKKRMEATYMTYLGIPTHFKLIPLWFVCLISLTLNGQETVIRDSIRSELRKAADFANSDRLAEAISIAEWALTVSSRYGFEKQESDAINILGISFAYLEKYEESLHYFDSYKKISEKRKDSGEVMFAYNNIGLVYSLMGDYEEAIAHYRKAFMYARTEKDRFLPNYNLGYNHMLKEEYPQAISYLEKALLLSETEDTLYKQGIYQNLYESYLGTGQKEKAEAHFMMTVSLAKRNKMLPDLIELYKIKLTKAYASDREMTMVKDSIILLQDSLILGIQDRTRKEAEALFNLERTEKELALMRKEQDFQKRFVIFLTLFVILLLLLFILLIRKNVQLVRTKSRAEVLAASKSKFYSEISHELRTPLYGVIELSNLLLDANNKNKHAEYTDYLKFSGNYLLALINNLLQMDKIESGKINVNNVSFQLDTLVNNIMDGFNYLVQSKQNTLVLNYDSSLPEQVFGDSLKISQILVNLLSNALKFTENGTITVSITNNSESKHEISVLFEVEDTGCGISPEQIELIFEEYHQEVKHTYDLERGAGLGLSIVLKFLKILGSTIHVESELGKGSKFYFYTNFRKKVLFEKRMDDLDESPLKHLDILVVDDNKINLLITQKIVQKNGGTCTSALSGFEAIEMAEKKSYDCILMDVNMPGLNGYQTSEHIRKFDTNVCIIMLTAVSVQEIQEEIPNYPVNGYILKPFINSIFVNTILTAVEDKIKME